MGIKYSILGLLHYEDMHGYRIKDHLEKNFGHMWSINYGQIYQNLKKMEEEGLVEMVEMAPSEDGGPRKKLYTVTDAGRDEFARWLAGSPERQMLLRDPFLTRFVFFGFGDDDRALETIDEQIDIYAEQLERRRQWPLFMWDGTTCWIFRTSLGQDWPGDRSPGTSPARKLRTFGIPTGEVGAST